MADVPLHPAEPEDVRQAKRAIEKAIRERNEESLRSLQPVPTAVWNDERDAEQLAVEHEKVSDVLPLAMVDEFYRQRGRTLLTLIFKYDPFDFWLWRFYVGLWGIIAVGAALMGAVLYFYQFMVVEGTYNILQARIDPPPLSVGLGIQSPGKPGFIWQMIVLFATIAFVSWGLRQVDISRKLHMGYEVPVCFFSVVMSWITLQWLRPLAMGAWGNGFPLGITHHLDWVSNVGYQYYNFFYNPFHAIGVSLLFFSTMLLAMHGSAIRSALRKPGTDSISLDMFWRGITIGYSIGEIGIHRIAFWTATAAILFSNLCIFLSGTLVYDWSGFWAFWDTLPWWSFGFAGIGVIALVWHKKHLPTQELLVRLERGQAGAETSFGIRGHINWAWVRRMFGNGQIGPFYLGVWGAIGLGFFSVTVLIVLLSYLQQVGYNPILFLRELPNLALAPPPVQYGLGWAPWNEGGNYLAATFFLHLSVLCWLARIYVRARVTGLGWDLARAFAAALFLYFVIYLIRPMLLGAWTEAPAHGLKAVLDWTNDVSIRTGNFYYNPFHMLSIFFLLGSTMILGMHGATILAAERYSAEKEVKEAAIEGPGTHRAQLFWRWTMGFNANASSIHQWAWWFANLCAITGGIGLLLSGTVIHNWFEWAQQVHIVAPGPSPADWQQYVQFANWPGYLPNPSGGLPGMH